MIKQKPRARSRYAASAPDLALAIGNDTLFSASYNKDAHSVPSTSYGDTTLIFTPRADQVACASRDCQNYDDTQMWYYLNHRLIINVVSTHHSVPTVDLCRID